MGLGSKRGKEIMKKKSQSFLTPLSPDQLRAEAERLLRDGNMPSLEEVAAAALAARMKYATKIRRARREAREKVVVN